MTIVIGLIVFQCLELGHLIPMKELFRKYVDNEIIQLDNNQFDKFIDFCGISDDFLKNSSQYDFIMYIKKRFEVFTMLMNRW